jgi:D-3-phosphoglycerate dehydrogenase
VKVVVSDSLAKEGLEILKATEGLTVDYRPGSAPEDLRAALADADGLIVRSATKATADLLAAAPNLKIIGRAGTGLDNVDVEAATARGIVVMNTPGGNAGAVAELTIGMLMSMARGIPAAHRALREGRWEKKGMLGREIFNKTLGIVGIGAIGSKVARYAQALRMNVLAYDPYISLDAAARLGVELTDLPTLFSRSDFVSIHIPLTPKTKNLVDAAMLAKMKPTAMIINIARGGIIDEAALADAIAGGRLAGAALDVFSPEPPAQDNPLLALDRVVVTPHLGASTHESQVAVGIEICKQVSQFFREGIISNAVNFPQVPPETLRTLRPYLALGERLGTFLGQYARGRMESLSVSYQGQVAAYPVSPITNAVLVGILGPIVGEMVNMVNAPVVAKERGLVISEVRGDEAVDYTSLITVTLVTDEGKSVVSGTLFGHSEPRILTVDDYLIEAEPTGHLLFFTNRDVPGVIGLVGTILGEAGVNIASFHLGRSLTAHRAVAMVNVDTVVPPEAIEILRQQSAIESVQLLHFPGN